MTQSPWKPISQHDGGTKEVLAMDEHGHVYRAWFFAPSSQTRNWIPFGKLVDARRAAKWTPTHFMEIPPL